MRADISERQRTINCRVDISLGRLGKHLLRGFHATHEDVIFRMGFANSSLVGKEYSAVDLEIVGSMAELEKNERTALIGFEEFVAVLPANHRLANAKAITLADLKDEPFLLGEPGPMRTVVEAMFTEAGLEPNVIGEMQLYSETLQMVRAGMGCCIAAEYTWLEDEEPELAVKKLEGMARGRYLYARIPEDREPSAATWELLAYIRKHAKSLMQ